MAMFFTADTHFGHANIIRYAKRPFDSVAEMDGWMQKEEFEHPELKYDRFVK